MSCRRVQRELMERLRFGELDGASAPHLDHLTTCDTCRDEVGFDRYLVRELQVALRARVAGYSPSPTAWQAVRVKVAQGESRSARLTIGLTSWMRAAAAGAAVLLAVVITSSQDYPQVRRIPPPLVASSTVREPVEYASIPPTMHTTVEIPFEWMPSDPVSPVAGTMPYVDATGVTPYQPATTAAVGGVPE